MNTRSFLFWLYDFIINRRAVAEYYNELVRTVGRTDDRHNEKLRKIMAYAVQNVPYYSGCKSDNILDFPVVNKTVIKNDIKQFVSKTVDINSLHKVTTSGSTGTPFTVFHDKTKRIHHTADNLFFMNLAGYTMGTPLYYMRVWNKYCSHGKLSNLLSNIHPVEIADLSEDVLSKIFDGIITGGGRKSIQAYASTYDTLCSFLQKKNICSLDADIEVMIAMSEHLSESTRKTLSEILHCPVVARYSNMENGFIGQQLPGTPWYLLNNCSYYVELLDLDSDKPVEKENELGRIVITDYYNFGMPMIRYDTGDLGTFERKMYKGEEITVLASIEGRRTDMIYQTNGAYASPHVITNTMWPYHSIKQWQFIQTGEKDDKFILNGVISKEEINELEKNLRGYLGNDANFVYEYVDNIPVLSSGKRKMIVNNMK